MFIQLKMKFYLNLFLLVIFFRTIACDSEMNAFKHKYENILRETIYNLDTNNDKMFGLTHTLPLHGGGRVRECYLRLPDGALYEVVPKYRVPVYNINFIESRWGLSPICGVHFRPIRQNLQGTYELYAFHERTGTLQSMLTRQRFTINVKDRA